MGKRLGKTADLFSDQGLCLMVLCAVLLLGGAAGCLFSGAAGQATVAELTQYLTDYLTAAEAGTAARCGFWSAAWRYVRLWCAVAIMGLTALGVAVIPGLFFARGFLLAFSTACFYRVFGGQGVWPAVVLFGLPALFWAPALFLSGWQSLSASLWLLRRWRGQERGSGPFSPVYWLRLAVLCGLMLLAGGVEKLYYAIAQGALPPGEGVIDAPIGRRGDSIIGRCVTPEGKPSRTEYTIIKEENGLSLAACVPVTGRTHQIRVHFASIGHSLAGDDLYGGSRERIGRQALHCARQSFAVPVYTPLPDGIRVEMPLQLRTVTVESPLPPDMEALFS